MNISLTELGMINALGDRKDDIWRSVYETPESGLTEVDSVLGQEAVPAGVVESNLPEIPAELSNLDCRNNALALAALKPIESSIRDVVNEVGSDRVGVIAGTSTSGIGAAEGAIDDWTTTGSLPDDFHYNQMEMGGLSSFVSRYLGVTGPSYTISTSCSSSAKVFASAAQLLRLGILDAAVVGGSDSLCGLTLNGFNSLQLLSDTPCKPMSAHRDGINIGEGAAFFLMESRKGSIQVAGVGESSDAHSMNAPDPTGKGAMNAMKSALNEADVTPDQLDYLNLHGTATPQNDAMEALAVESVLGRETSVASTKRFTGHALGAAGALETGLCWMMLNRAGTKGLPMVPHRYDEDYDEELPDLNLVENSHEQSTTQPHFVMTNSFAFGGHNCSVLLRGRCNGS
jgi:3-oxoacyl-[acyl-carrier-protein] synthase-1